MRIVSSKQPDGTFYYEVFNGDVLIDSGSGYPTQQAANRASNVVYHALHAANFAWNQPATVHDYVEISIDELAKELEGML